MRAWLYGDGEAIVGEALELEIVKGKIASMHVDIGKTPASCSAKTQASDISDDFKAEKKYLKHIANHADWDLNISLRARLKAIMDSKVTTMSSDYRRKVTDGLMQLVYVAKNVLKENIVSKGYTKYGQGSDLNFLKIMSACARNISVGEFAILTAALPHAILQMQANHFLRE